MEEGVTSMQSFLSTHKRNLTIYFVLVAIAIAIVIPVLIIVLAPTSYNALTQFLFDIILTAGSIWIGDALSKEQARKQATEKWIPAAESASKALLAMSATVDRMQRRRGRGCNALAAVSANIPPENAALVQAIIQTRGDTCLEGLSSLKFHIDNSFSDWDAFIETNCENVVCEDIHRRLDEKRQELDKTLNEAFPETLPTG